MGVDASTPSGVTKAYRRLMRLSEGGMGQVDLCIREGGTFRRLYAMKRLKPAIRDDETCRSMFVEEARLAGLVHHPNVVSVLDVGEDAEGPFLVMEYIEGITAADLLRHSAADEIPLPISVCMEVVAQAARGLGEAHSQTSHDGEPLNLVHRDVSPHNILIDYNGRAQVTDFGIARATGNSHKTSTGVLKGKLGYMAPEVLQFAPVDARTDIFGLGVVLFELLVGRRLYAGDDRERARRIVTEPPPDIGDERPEVPPAVQGLVVSMLAKLPEERPRSALYVAERLEEALDRLRPDPDYCGLRDYVEDHFQEARELRQSEIQESLDASEKNAVQPSSKRRWHRGLLLVAPLLAGAAATLWWAAPTTPMPSPAKLVEVAEVEAPPPAVVQVQVNTSPPGARVRGPGVDTRTPASFTLPRGEDPIEFEIRRGGYRVHSLQLVPSEDLELEVELRRVRRRRRTKSSTPQGLREIWD